MHQETELFGFEEFMDKDNSSLDDTQITTTLIYYSQDELKEFKQLSKELIKKYYGEEYKDGNVSDLILKVFRNELR